jgi:hypothetical protein
MKRRSNASPRRARRSPRPGQAERYHYEYERNGVANLFMMFAPLEGWRRVKVTDRRAAVDYAHALKDLSDMHFPGADKIVLAQDNLSTHTAASLYEAFPAAEARRLVERFERRYTPKHGSWLDTAESELAVLSTQCLDRRICDKADLVAEVAACKSAATLCTPRRIGNSQPPTPVSSSQAYTLSSSDSGS